jgi:hypothetical protein
MVTQCSIIGNFLIILSFINFFSKLYAWSLADQLIRMNQNSEVTCLSAQILRHKVKQFQLILCFSWKFFRVDST